MADSPPVSDSLPPPWMAKSSTRFRHGIPPSANRDATVHVVAARIPMQWDDKKNTCPKTNAQCVWAETGWPCLEEVYGPGNERLQVYAKQI